MTMNALSPLASLGAFLALGCSVASASQGLELSWWINDELADAITIPGTDLGNGMFNYEGVLTYTNPENELEEVILTWNLNGAPGGPGRALISGNLHVENLFASTIDVRILPELPKTMASQVTALDGSSAIGLMTDAGGGTVASLPSGVPVWQAVMDGAPVGPEAAMFLAPWDLHIPGQGSDSTSASFGIPVPVPGPAMTSAIGFDVNYSLTPGDVASITSVFTVGIPGPGGLVMLMVTGLLTPKRRR